MSGSTDSLKKKVCVTVFLDELFEEVLEDNWTDLKQVSEVTESEVKLAEEPFKGPPRIALGNDEKVNVSQNADAERNEVHLRPRKHRRESKFSENLYDGFQGELAEYEYGSKFKAYDEWCESVESPISDSDLDLDDLLGGDQWTISKSSFSELSDSSLSAECFLSINNQPSSLLLTQTTEDAPPPPTFQTVANGNKCIRSGENVEEEAKKPGVEVEDENYFDKGGRNTGKDILAWKRTQKEIQLVLANAKGKQLETEATTGDFEDHYNLRSILEACVKAKEENGMKDALFFADEDTPKANNEAKESLSKVLRDSNARDFPNQKTEFGSREVKKVCIKRNLWNDCFESDPSEVETPKGIPLGPMSNESVLCYTLCLRCKRSVYPPPRTVESASFDAAHSSTMYSTSRESSFESLKSQNPDLLVRTVTRLASKSIMGTMLKSDQSHKEEGRSEGYLSTDSQKRPPAIDAEADAYSQHPKLKSDPEEKSKGICSEVLGQVREPRCKRDVVNNRGEETVNHRGGHAARIERELLSPTSSSHQRIAEILFKPHYKSGNLERCMTDAESEMIFAESENSYGNDDFESSTESMVLGTPRKDIRILEFEDNLSHSKILRRMKTVEILGDSSLNDMNTRISTEVFLICENISSNEVSLEAWHSSASTLKSFTEMRQCYLKDSKDSTMYLIEIPLHFVRIGKQQPATDASVSD